MTASISRSLIAARWRAKVLSVRSNSSAETSRNQQILSQKTVLKFFYQAFVNQSRKLGISLYIDRKSQINSPCFEQYIRFDRSWKITKI